MIERCYVVTCDHCQGGFTLETEEGRTAAEAVDVARGLGWKMGMKHTCPTCQGLAKTRAQQDRADEE